MDSNTDFTLARQNVEAATVEKKRLAAEALFEQLTDFAQSISADVSGDGDFDLELSKSIHMSRACLLRWLALNRAQHVKISRIDLR